MPATARLFIPNWLIPTPCPQPEPVKVTASSGERPEMLKPLDWPAAPDESVGMNSAATRASSVQATEHVRAVRVISLFKS